MPDEFDLALIRDRVRAAVQEDGGFITTAELETFIQQGILQVNRDVPLEDVFDIAGDDSQDYALPAANFEKGFSTLDAVESPAGENPPRIKDRDDDWFFYEDPSKGAGLQNRLRFITITPKTGETIRVGTTSRHTVTDTTSTLNQNQFLGVVYFAVSGIFRAMAAKFAQSTDPGISADSVDYGGRSQNYLFIGERYDTLYRKVTGLSSDLKPAQAQGEHDARYNHGERYLWRTERSR